MACLTAATPANLAPLSGAVKRAIEAGWTPFEVVAGTPAARYGPRLTLRPNASGGASEAERAQAAGFPAHPWGPPDGLGLRMAQHGTVQAKGYHRAERATGLPPLPEWLPLGLYPVMASTDGPTAELYLRLGPQRSWSSFVQECTATLGGDPFTFAPHPHPSPHAFCLTLRWHERVLSAVTVLADERALPPDDRVRASWTEAMDEEDRRAYELALAGVRSQGRRGTRAWHAMLGWSLEAGSGWHRAASLRVPAR